MLNPFDAKLRILFQLTITEFSPIPASPVFKNPRSAMFGIDVDRRLLCHPKPY
jgi:hypothetical protein